MTDVCRKCRPLARFRRWTARTIRRIANVGQCPTKNSGCPSMSYQKIRHFLTLIHTITILVFSYCILEPSHATADVRRLENLMAQIQGDRARIYTLPAEGSCLCCAEAPATRHATSARQVPPSRARLSSRRRTHYKVFPGIPERRMVTDRKRPNSCSSSIRPDARGDRNSRTLRL